MSTAGSFGMLKYEGGGGWPRACDECHAAAGAVYCRADEAYLCGGCDARVHHANRVASRHERVPVCEACELAPAALTCRADAAALCVPCDADVHSANPLARRHQRLPVLPLPPVSSLDCLLPGPPFAAAKTPAVAEAVEDNGEDEAASWLLFAENCNQSNHERFFGEDQVDEYLDLVGYNTCKDIQTRDKQQKYGNSEGNECVVPSQGQQMQLRQQQHQHQQQQLSCYPVLPLPPFSSLDCLLRGPPFAAAETPAVAEEVEDNGEDEAASWLLFAENCNQSNHERFFGEDQVDEYLDLVGYNTCKDIQTREQQQKYGNNEGNECVVPSQGQQMQLQQQQHQQQQQLSCYGMEMEYEMSNAELNTASICHSVSFASMDVSVVPDAATAGAELSKPRFGTSKGGGAADMELFAGGLAIQLLSQFPANREARVLRYREKRKARKFEKTIRYASKKAYAETRPRIKGRFAKSSDVQQEVINAVFSTSSVPSDGSYGIVPSFW